MRSLLLKDCLRRELGSLLLPQGGALKEFDIVGGEGVVERCHLWGRRGDYDVEKWTNELSIMDGSGRRWRGRGGERKEAWIREEEE